MEQVNQTINNQQLANAYMQTRRVIQSLKDTVTGEDQAPNWPNATRLFQSLLEAVGTPESVEQTLELIKQLKAQSLMFHVRELQQGKITRTETIERINVDAEQVLLKEIEGQPTNLFIQIDVLLAQRFKEFLTEISEPEEDPEKISAAITKIDQDFPFPEFQANFCKFLDQILNSLLVSPQIELMAEGTLLTDFDNVRLRATDLVTVISKEDLQAIHKGNDPVLMDFLEQYNMLGIVEQKNGYSDNNLMNSSGDLGDSSNYDYDVLSGLTGDGHVKMDPSMKSSKHSKRKRPHEDSVSTKEEAKRRSRGRPSASASQDWNSEAYNSEVSPELPSKSFIPMKEIALSVRKSSNGVPDMANSQDDRSAPRTPQRAAGTTITGQRKRKRWTDEEVDFLLEGVRLFGVGSWKDILNHFQFGDRTYVDLKDKFRNLRKHYSLEELLGTQENNA